MNKHNLSDKKYGQGCKIPSRCSINKQQIKNKPIKKKKKPAKKKPAKKKIIKQEEKEEKKE